MRKIVVAANRMVKVGYDGPLTFELHSVNRPDRHTHDRYGNPDFDTFVRMAYEKAKTFREIFEKAKNC